MSSFSWWLCLPKKLCSISCLPYYLIFVHSSLTSSGTNFGLLFSYLAWMVMLIQLGYILNSVMTKFLVCSKFSLSCVLQSTASALSLLGIVFSSFLPGASFRRLIDIISQFLSYLKIWSTYNHQPFACF